MSTTASVTTVVPSRRSGVLRKILRNHLPGLVVVALAGGLVAGFFLGLYQAKGYKMPIGWDTARYLDQTNLVAARGLSGVSDLDLPRPSQTLTSRVGFPITVLTLSRLTTGSTFQLATVVPIAAIAGTALATGAFVSYSFRRSAWDLAVIALVVGISAAMVRLIAGTFTENLLAASVVGAALVPLSSAARGREGLAGAIIAFAAAGLIHTAFFAFMAVVLAAVAAAYAPGSWRSWRRGRVPLLGTPTARVATTMAGAGAGVALGIYGVLGTTPSTAEGLLSRQGNLARFRLDVPLYRLWLTAPIAAVGAGVLVAESTGSSPSPSPEPEVNGQAEGNADPPMASRRFAIVLLLAWGAVGGLGIAAFYLGRNLPAHRFLAFLLPLPVLVGVAILAVGRVIAGKASRILGFGLVGAGILSMGYLGYHDLYGTLVRRGVEWLDQAKIRDAATARLYLDRMGIPVGSPVVYVIDDSGPNPQEYLPELAHIMRSAFPADRIERAWFYVGTPENYLAGRPTLLEDDTRRYNIPSGRFWRDLQPVLAQPGRPVALMLSSFNPSYTRFLSAHREWQAAPGVIVLNGPRATVRLPAAHIEAAPQGPFKLALFGSGTLVLLSLVGLGWALALLPRDARSFEVLALSIGFGVALLVVTGMLVDSAGFRLGGVAGGLTPVAVAVLGWGLAAGRFRRRGLKVLAG